MNEIELLARLRDDVPDLDPAAEARVRTRLLAAATAPSPADPPVPLPRRHRVASLRRARGTPAAGPGPDPTGAVGPADAGRRPGGNRRPGGRRRAGRRVGIAAAAAAAVLAGGIVLTSDDGGPIAATPAAAAVLDRAAVAAVRAEPLPVPGPGQVLYVRTTGKQYEGSGRYCSSVHETWQPVDPGADTRIRIRRTDGIVVTSATADPTTMPKEAGCFQSSFDDVDPPGVGPSAGPTDFAALPTDPAALYAEIVSRYDGSSASKDEASLVALTDLAGTNSPYLTPALRAAIYRAMALVPGVDVVGSGVDALGRTGTVLARTEPVRGTRAEFILDPATGQILGDRHRVVDPGDAEADVPAGTVTWQSAAVVSVVDRVGDLPTG
jgi:hypothetical protein